MDYSLYNEKEMMLEILVVRSMLLAAFLKHGCAAKAAGVAWLAVAELFTLVRNSGEAVRGGFGGLRLLSALASGRRWTTLINTIVHAGYCL